MSFQYKIQVKNIYKIVTKHGEANYKDYFYKVVLDEIDQYCTTSTADEIFNNQKEAENKLSELLKKRVLKDIYHDIIYFQLNYVKLPGNIPKLIENTVIQQLTLKFKD